MGVVTTIRRPRHKLGEGDPPPRLTVRQIKELLRAPDGRTKQGRRDAALLAVLLGTGARIGEVTHLTVHDIERDANGMMLLTLHTLKRRKPTTRVVALPAPFSAYLQRHLSSARPTLWAFDGRTKGDHWRTGELSVRAAQEAVTEHLRKVAPHLRVHDLRHCAASLMLRLTGNAWAVSKVLGHASIKYTETVYAHYMARDAKYVGSAVGEAFSSRKGVAA